MKTSIAIATTLLMYMLNTPALAVSGHMQRAAVKVCVTNAAWQTALTSPRTDFEAAVVTVIDRGSDHAGSSNQPQMVAKER